MLNPINVQESVTHGKLWLNKERSAWLHYTVAGSGEKVALLIHGAPQTWYAWRRLIQPLTRAGYRLIMPDYRGAGGSSKPVSGYEKWTMAADLHTLVHDHLGIREPITLVGHDVGMMVAHAYALRYRDQVLTYTGMEAPLPGTSMYETQKGSRELWHFNFHATRDIPEILTQGKERFYIKRFFDDLSYNPDAISPEDLEYYARWFEGPGAMRAMFEVYRAMEHDAADNRAAIERDGKLTVPVLATGGAEHFFAGECGQMLSEHAMNVTHSVIPEAGHWVAEENPQAFSELLIDFDQQARA